MLNELTYALIKRILIKQKAFVNAKIQLQNNKIAVTVKNINDIIFDVSSSGITKQVINKKLELVNANSNLIALYHKKIDFFNGGEVTDTIFPGEGLTEAQEKNYHMVKS